MTDNPSNPPAAPTLEDLLKTITPANCHEETSTGPAVGREYGRWFADWRASPLPS